jgi:hypothetical protein
MTRSDIDNHSRFGCWPRKSSACAFLDVIMVSFQLADLPSNYCRHDFQNVALPRTQAFLTFYCLLSKLYANTFLATSVLSPSSWCRIIPTNHTHIFRLNARNVLRSEGEYTDPSSIRSEIFAPRTDTRPDLSGVSSSISLPACRHLLCRHQGAIEEDGQTKTVLESISQHRIEIKVAVEV